MYAGLGTRTQAPCATLAASGAKKSGLGLGSGLWGSGFRGLGVQGCRACLGFRVQGGKPSDIRFRSPVICTPGSALEA